MQTSKTTNAASVTPTLADIQKLTPTEAANRAFGEIRAVGRAFITIAKIMLRLEPDLKPGQTLGQVVIKLASVPADYRRRVKSTIDNARYAMRVWKELVAEGHITEEQFDGFTFHDCFLINRVMSGASRQQLKAGDVAMFLQASPADWHEQLDCLYTYGQTVEDRAAVSQASKPDASDGASSPSSEQQPDADAPTDVPVVEPEKSDKPKEPKSPNPPAQEPSNVVRFEPETATGETAVEKALQLVNALEAIIGSLPPSEVEKLVPAIDQLAATVHALAVVPPKAAAKRKVARAKKIAKPASVHAKAA